MSLIKAVPWVGAVQEDKVTLKAAVLESAQNIELVYSKDESMQDRIKPDSVEAVPNRDYKIFTFKLTGLDTGTRYFYDLRADDSTKKGKFKTFPKKGEKAGFRFGFASCSNQISFLPNPKVYEAIVKEDDLLFFCDTGDLHYADLRNNPVEERIDKYIETLEIKGMRELFPNLPVPYCWDDHDFLGNNSGGGEPDQETDAQKALEAYNLFVPHYDFSNVDDGLYQEFCVGNVLFLMTDTRFRRTVSPRTTMLGELQKEWLKQKFIEGQKNDLIVWINGVPWIGDVPWWKPWEYLFNFDDWYQYRDERKELAQFIKDNNITNLCMISGDAHMIAIDDGSHSGYAENRKGGFPIFHSATLSSIPSWKGGPYSKGKTDNKKGRGIAGRSQYGIFEVRYENDQLHARWEGKRAKKGGKAEVKITHDFKSPGTFDGF